MNESFSQLGLLAWPLLFCSILSLTIIVERAVFFLSVTLTPARIDEHSIDRLTVLSLQCRSQLKQCVGWRSRYSSEAIQFMSQHIALPKPLREEVVSLWCGQRSKRLKAQLPWLTLIALISPLLGLLGTVLGMIQAFQSLAAHSGPIQPALVADGLQQAMLTTAVGLAIAVPTLISLHVFRVWSKNISSQVETMLNRVNLMVEGVTEFGDEPLPTVTKLALYQAEQ